MDLIHSYLDYIKYVRRYSQRTYEIYHDVLQEWCHWVDQAGFASEPGIFSEVDISPTSIRSYEVWLLDKKKMVPKTVNLHLTVMSSFCRYLVKKGFLESNPVSMVSRPKLAKRLPEFYRKESMDLYFNNSSYCAGTEAFEIFRLAWEGESGTLVRAQEMYNERLRRAIVLTLYSLGLRRAELISLSIGDLDFRRRSATIRGKGDKMREIPLTDSFCKEISLYLQTVEVLIGRSRSLKEPVFVTLKGLPLYPSFVDKAVKSELSGVKGISGRLSAHVLRHSLATELLSEGAGLNSIKELLGHSSLAATQVYTHNTITQIKTIYQSAHPRAKNGGKHGD